MNKQEIFDKVSKHLLTQNAKSLGSRGCAYRGANGAMCAVGCLIKDEFYSDKIEGYNVFGDSVRTALKNSGVIFTRSDEIFDEIESMLVDLQKTHDYGDPSEWRDALIKLAEKHKVQFND